MAFVVSLNLHRRHLTESQRASVAAKLANMTVGGKETNSANLQNCAQVSQSDAAKMLNVSTRSVSDAAKVIHNAAPELVKAMDEGRASVSAAAALLTRTIVGWLRMGDGSDLKSSPWTSNPVGPRACARTVHPPENFPEGQGWASRVRAYCSRNSGQPCSMASPVAAPSVRWPGVCQRKPAPAPPIPCAPDRAQPHPVENFPQGLFPCAPDRVPHPCTPSQK